ncbi:pre-rRNA-processing protein ESF1 Ecym_4790 [Eremothecium cymbalariae DBVPG|uniref:Uncharacterized protein n=1 Tax=Eremothecium cymbalariae (strain CBS 270.75 / DBVPG 7215 / KCTC 17166 / NRRL Y-17582) TaxID=931890 RepID=G8JSS9_ERECY|nr:hypothetical protein Ecym_4790 [Eremothecium cymbalariae DBVPG\
MSDKREKRDPVTNDSRFAGIHNDPKFRKPKVNKLKITLDDRFSKKDLEFKRKAKVDKYGRRIGSYDEKEAKDFDRYFSKNESVEKIQSDDEEGETEDIAVSALDRARGEVPLDYESSSDENSSSESEEESEDSALDPDSELEIEESKPETGDPTKVFAVVNLDWDHVRSVDLLATFNSFVPNGGSIKKVAIYPSEFGKERMKREEVEGPPRELFKRKQSKKEKDSDDENSDIDINDLYEVDDAEKDYDSKALRRYQLDRLRYYYAVVYCSDVLTAKAIYQNCDGTEFESTANMFDLRYVPDNMKFEDDPRDQCVSVPKDYKPTQFSTSALQHSQVKLTWDETPADRVEISKRAFNQKEIEEMDFKAYLASDSDSSEGETNEKTKNALRSLVNDSIQVAHKSVFDKHGSEEEADVEITFTPGLENGDAPKEENEEETALDKIKRKEKERRKKRKERVKELKMQAIDEKKARRRKGDDGAVTEAEKELRKKKQAELELLMLEDETGKKSTLNNNAHFNMNEIIKSQKEKTKKSRYQNKNVIVDDNFKPDLNDPRFKEVFEDHDFAIDPSQPEFKKTPAMKEILEERTRRSSKMKKAFNKRKASYDHPQSGQTDSLNSLVEKFKKKHKKVHKK